MKGIYALAISVSKDVVVKVGALRDIQFQKGFYVYVGSAQNSIEKRAARHLKKIKRKFWHIDYMLDADGVVIQKVFQKSGARSEECKVAERLSRMGIVIEGFGSSDCRCRGHLFKVESCEFLKDWMNELSP
jgi:Uri superfamily endonuclease